MGQTFCKADRLLHRTQFLAVQSTGRRLHTPHFVVLLQGRGDEAPARLGLVTSRKVANAVGRNRVRRLLREVFRAQRAAFPVGCDVVVIARTGAHALARAEVQNEILTALARPRPRGAPAAEPAKGGRTP